MKDRQQKVEKVKSLIQQAQDLLDLKYPSNNDVELQSQMDKYSALISELEDAKTSLLNIPMVDTMIKRLNDNLEKMVKHMWLPEEEAQKVSEESLSDSRAEFDIAELLHNVSFKNAEPADQLRALLKEADLEKLDARIVELEQMLVEYEKELGIGGDEFQASGIENAYKWLEMEDVQEELALMKDVRKLKAAISTSRVSGIKILGELTTEYDKNMMISESLLEDIRKESKFNLEPGEKGYEEFKKRGGLEPSAKQVQLEELRKGQMLLKVKIDFVNAALSKNQTKSTFESQEFKALNEKLSKAKMQFDNLRKALEKVRSEIEDIGPAVNVGQVSKAINLEGQLRDLGKNIAFMLEAKDKKLKQIVEESDKDRVEIDNLCAKSSFEITDDDYDKMEHLAVKFNGFIQEIEGTKEAESMNNVLVKLINKQWERFYIQFPVDHVVHELTQNPDLIKDMSEFHAKIKAELVADKDVDQSELIQVDRKLDLAKVVLNAKEMLDYNELYNANQLDDIVLKLENALTESDNTNLVGEIKGIISDLKALKVEREQSKSSGQENIAPNVQDWVAKGAKEVGQEKASAKEVVKVESGKSQEIK